MPVSIPVLRKFFAMVVFAANPACSVSAAESNLQFFPPKSPAPYSDAVQAGDFLFLAGQPGIGKGPTPTEKFDNAAREAMDGLVATLKAHNTGLDHVVQCNVMLTDMNNRQAFNSIYASYFKVGKFPARDSFGVTGLADDALLEIVCVAYHPAEK